MTDLNWILENFYRSTLIPCCLYEDGEILKNYSESDLNLAFSSYIANYMKEQFAPLAYTVTEERIFMGYVQVNHGNQYVFIGPTTAFKTTNEQAKKLLKALSLPFAQVNALIYALNRHSRFTTSQSLQFLTLLDFLVNGEKDRDIHFFSSAHHKTPRKIVTPEIPFLVNVDGSMEKETLSYIEHGQIDLLQKNLDQLFGSAMDVPPVSPDLEHAMKRLFIVNVGIVSRTALRGGIDYSTMTEMTSYYLIKIDSVNGFREISGLIYEMFMSFAREVVRQTQVSTHTLLSKKIKQIIFSHLNEKITPTMIAEIIEMDVSYLCRHFKKETGLTIATFVNQVKINECQRLLRSTNMTILDISVQLGFASPHYMTKIFKKIVDLTPSEYREGHL